MSFHTASLSVTNGHWLNLIMPRFSEAFHKDRKTGENERNQ
jgi:hypothetical protein